MKQTAICTFCFSILKHCALILSFTRFIWMKKEKQSVKCSKKMYPLLQPILISCRIWEGLCYYIELRARGNFFFFILCTFGWEKNLLIYTDQNFDLLDWPILLKKRLDSIQGSPCVLLLYATMALRLQLLGKWFANSMFCSYFIYYFK